MQKSDIVIVGGVAAGPKTAATLVRRNPDVKVTLFQKDEILSYSSCGLPFFASGDLASFDSLTATPYGVPRNADFFRDSRRFESTTGSEVIKIDREARIVSVKILATGEVFRCGYDKLVIATGASPVNPPFEVSQGELVSSFHTPDDAIRFRKLAEQGKIGKVAIVGGSFVGCELAEAVGSLWGIETVLIEREKQLLPGMLDPEMAALVKRELLNQDIEVLTDCMVESVTLSSDGQPVVSISGSNDIAADYVFLAVGLRPNVELARQSGLDIGASGAIAVNSKMQTSDPNIYAGGDCVESIHQLTGKPLNLCMGSLANRHGRVIAENLAGGDVEFPGVLGTQILKVFDLNVGAVGLTEEEALRAGFPVKTVWGSFTDKPEYMPEVKTMVLKMVYNTENYRILGLQAAGHGDISRRIDVAAVY
ncbi:MAG: pyridine nucleotide-disulfide oxidoreductase, partial [Candidatus Zixiibacteriota bacterium]